MSPDKQLMLSRDEILTLLAELCDCGLEDRHEATVKLDGISEVVGELRKRVEQIADENAERNERAHESFWVSEFNRVLDPAGEKRR